MKQAEILDTPPHADVEEVDILQQSLGHAFDSVFANPHRFNAQELASVRYVYEHINVDVTDMAENVFGFSNNKEDDPSEYDDDLPLEFTFLGPEGEMAQYAPILDFTAAHELKHASLDTTRLEHGKINIHSIARVLRRLTFKNHISTLEEDSYDADDEQEATRLGNISKGLRFIDRLNPFAYAYALVSQKVEFLCDSFAVRTVPDTNIEQFRDFALEHQNGASINKPESALGAFVQNIRLCALDLWKQETHPHAERRYRNMKQTQDKLLNS